MQESPNITNSVPYSPMWRITLVKCSNSSKRHNGIFNDTENEEKTKLLAGTTKWRGDTQAATLRVPSLMHTQAGQPSCVRARVHSAHIP